MLNASFPTFGYSLPTDATLNLHGPADLGGSCCAHEDEHVVAYVSGLVLNGAYQFQVFAGSFSDKEFETVGSNIATGYTTAPPNPVTSLESLYLIGANQTRLRWSDPGGERYCGRTLFQLFRSSPLLRWLDQGPPPPAPAPPAPRAPAAGARAERVVFVRRSTTRRRRRGTSCPFPGRWTRRAPRWWTWWWTARRASRTFSGTTPPRPAPPRPAPPRPAPALACPRPPRARARARASSAPALVVPPPRAPLLGQAVHPCHGLTGGAARARAGCVRCARIISGGGRPRSPT